MALVQHTSFNAVETHVSTSVPDLKVFTNPVHIDERGLFSKIYTSSLVANADLESAAGVCIFKEAYYSISKRDVLRGFHLQLPPHHHWKCVHCVEGEILDVIIDLRLGTPAFGQWEQCRLAAGGGRSIMIPPGCGHAFLVLSDSATVMYNVSSEHAPSSDTGVRWDIEGLKWPVTSPILSARDTALPTLGEYTERYSSLVNPSDWFSKHE